MTRPRQIIHGRDGGTTEMDQPRCSSTAPPDARSDAPPTPPPESREDPVFSDPGGDSAPTGADTLPELKEPEQAEAPDAGGPDFDRPTTDRPVIRARNGGRQILISTGPDLSGDTDLPDVQQGDDQAGEGDQSAPANGQTPPTRGRIDGFSADSRRRLRERLHAIRRDAKGVFLTLTYHQTRPSPDRAKRDLDVFWKRLRERYGGEHVGGISAVWKMEPQKRGAPHFHLIVYGIDFIPAQEVSRIWHDVTAEESSQHAQSGVDVESAVNEDGKLQTYLAKYMAETYEGWPGAEPGDPWANMGRWWGSLGREHLPVAEWEPEGVALHQREAQKLIRELLDEWDVDIPDGVIPPSLLINCRGDAGQRLLRLLDRL
jgi:hypothetical protein